MADILIDNACNDDPRKGETPVFLKVLCILTLMGSVLAALTALTGIKLSDKMIESFSQNMDLSSAFGSDNNYMDAFERNLINYYTWLLYFCYALLSGSLLSIAGAIIMLFRRKAGFFLYLVGEVVPAILLILTITAAQKVTPLSIVEWAIHAVFIMISTIFIMLYTLNYKQLR